MENETAQAKEETKKRFVPTTRVRPCRAGGRHQVGWCFRMCTPVDGKGLCGRQAPHALQGRWRIAIMNEVARRESEA